MAAAEKENLSCYDSSSNNCRGGHDPAKYRFSFSQSAGERGIDYTLVADLLRRFLTDKLELAGPRVMGLISQLSGSSVGAVEVDMELSEVRTLVKQLDRAEREAASGPASGSGKGHEAVSPAAT